MQFGHGVHIGGRFAVDHIAEQSCSGGADTCHAEVGVVGGGGRSGGVTVGAVGRVQHFVERVDDGLQLGRRIGLGAVHGGRSQRVVDGVHMGGGHAGHTRVGVGGGIRRCACVQGQTQRVVLREAAQGVQRKTDVVHGGLQLAQRIGLAAVVVFGGDGGQHGRQVVGRDTGEADQAQVCFGERRRGCAPSRKGLDGVGDAGQFVEFGDGVHTCRGFGAHQVVEQGEVLRRSGCCANADAKGGVFSGSGVTRGIGIGCRAIGFAQDGVVRIDDGLHFSG